MSAIAMVVVFAPILRRADTKMVLIGIVAALLLVAPWFYWTAVLQPGGTALTRYQLADDLGFDHRTKSLLSSVLEMLRYWGFSRWMQEKIDSVCLAFHIYGPFSFGVPLDANGPSAIANQRTLDFLVVTRNIGLGSIGVAGLMAGWVLRQYKDALAIRLALCGILAIVGMMLATVQIGIAASQAFGSLLMLSIAGGMYLTQVWPKLSRALFTVWLFYFVVTWILNPLARADRIHGITALLGAAWLGVLVYAIFLWRKSLLLPANHNALWDAPQTVLAGGYN
jgi:hypothetical protein